MSPWHQTARMKELSRARVWCCLVSLHTLFVLLWLVFSYIASLRGASIVPEEAPMIPTLHSVLTGVAGNLL